MTDDEIVTDLRNKVIELIIDHVNSLDNVSLIAGYVGKGYMDSKLMAEFYETVKQSGEL